MENPFPAVLIGGPPHSGKSVLVYSLTQALRQANVPHYALRACPDAEGDWANEADQQTVRAIRVKGEFSDEFMARVAWYLQQRPLPLLVDVGGRPTAEQEAIFRYCTHAILLAGEEKDEPTAFEHDMAEWQAKMARQGVPVFARCKSVLHGENELLSTQPIITGTLAGLERGQIATGPTFTALVEKLQELFTFPAVDLTELHLAQAPVELTLDLGALARTWQIVDGRWQPDHLPQLWDYLPEGKPLAIYGRAPNWLYATLAMVAYPAPFWLYDARLGWVQPPILPLQADERQTGWQVAAYDQPDFTLLDMTTHSQYLDIEEADGLPLMPVSTDKGLVLSGKIPHWLLTAVTRRFAPLLPWTAVYQPPLGQAIVIYSKETAVSIGEKILLTLPRFLISNS